MNNIASQAYTESPACGSDQGVLLLAKCWIVEDVAEALLMDNVTVRRWHKELSGRRRGSVVANAK